MPTISVNKADLFKALGQEFTTEEFDELCFEFGIELDEDTTDQKRPIVDGVEEPPQLKIDIPANRYDMVCFEGIALNLNVFRQRIDFPNYRLVHPPSGELEKVFVKPDTMKIRPFFSCAILRGIKFTPERYNSFMALQDKLHANLARQRTLVAIGTHDLSTIKGPFTYDALPPSEIEFAPLNQTKSMNGNQLMEFYEKDRHLAKFLPIIRDSPVYPIIYDSNKTVLSLPPIINSNHSKITLDTTDVFIDITAVDKTKLEIVNHIICSMFSQYCSEPFTIEPVQIISDHNNETRVAPDISPRQFEASIPYINSCCGLDLSAQEICDLLVRMSHRATPHPSKKDSILVSVPITRADVLHEADIMEDVAVAYGFNRLPRYFPNKSASVGAPLPINRLTDIIRNEAAMAGWVEVMPLILCSHDENFAWLNKTDDGKTAVKLANPKTAEYQVVRTSLIPGLLKTIRENKHRPMPLKIFESSDVAFKDESAERKSRNERHFAAAWIGKSSGFEAVHGLLNRLMLMLDYNFLLDDKEIADDSVPGYWIEEIDDATYLPGHAASVTVRNKGEKPLRIGEFGILHPTVLKNFELGYPVSTLELNIEPLL